MSTSTLRRLLDLFDVTPAGPGNRHFTAGSDGGGRQIVDGSQLLAQAVVAAAKAFPDHTVRSAHMMFASAAKPDETLEFTVNPVKTGRSYAFATITTTQGPHTRATANLLLDRPTPDVIRHDQWTGPPPAGPQTAHPSPMPLPGRELRLENIHQRDDPDETGPPIIDAWLHYDPHPHRDDLQRALLAHFTGHLSLSTTMRPHPGIGTAQAHHTLSTAPLAISVHFHEPTTWTGWIRYHHHSTYAGAGMSHVHGQILTEQGRLIASFTQDAMLRAFDTHPTHPVESRL